MGAVAQAVFVILLERFAHADHGSIHFPLWMLMLPMVGVFALPAALSVTARWLALTAEG